LRERLDTTRNLLGTRALTLSPRADDPPSAKPLANVPRTFANAAKPPRNPRSATISGQRCASRPRSG